MRKMIFLLFLLYQFNSINSYNKESNKNYFLLYPPEDKNQSYTFQFIDQELAYTINTTEGENMKTINVYPIRDKKPIHKLSSVIEYKKSFIVKTCFGPNKIVEILDERKNIYSPQDDYFKKLENLENIEYCYSTYISNPYKIGEHTIVIYWTEKIEIQEKKNYIHRSILFFPTKKAFSEIYTLDTEEKELYAQSCTNLMNKFIYCNIDPSFPQLKNNHFSIILLYEAAENIKIKFNLVTVQSNPTILRSLIYSKPIGIYKYIYSSKGKYGYYFLTEYHDQANDKTRLVTSLYINMNSLSLILETEKMGKLEVYHGINIENFYISPDLFNTLLPNEKEIIIIYMMKGAQDQNLLLLNRYDYNKDLKNKTELDKYSKSSYLREDICKNPKYMQSMFVTSFIDYNEDEKKIIRENKNKQFYKYQRDIATIISCDYENEIDRTFYEAKKIKMPQCINTLNEINGINNTLIFPKNDTKIIINFDSDPNYKSLKDVYIELEDTDLYLNHIIVQSITNGKYSSQGETSFKNIDGLLFSRTFNFRKNKKYKIPYRIKETNSKDNSTKCNLISDSCYFEISLEKDETENGQEEEEKCENWDDNICTKCEDIIGIIPKNNECDCHCNVNNGFKLEPNTTINRCVCENGYSFYKDINKCLPNEILNNGSFCIIDIDEETLIYIYDDLQKGKYSYIENGLPKCINFTEISPPVASTDKSTGESISKPTENPTSKPIVESTGELKSQPTYKPPPIDISKPTVEPTDEPKVPIIESIAVKPTIKYTAQPSPETIQQFPTQYITPYITHIISQSHPQTYPEPTSKLTEKQTIQLTTQNVPQSTIPIIPKFTEKPTILPPLQQTTQNIVQSTLQNTIKHTTGTPPEITEKLTSPPNIEHTIQTIAQSVPHNTIDPSIKPTSPPTPKNTINTIMPTIKQIEYSTANPSTKTPPPVEPTVKPSTISIDQSNGGSKGLTTIQSSGESTEESKIKLTENTSSPESNKNSTEQIKGEYNIDSTGEILETLYSTVETSCDKGIWFNLGDDKFNWIKIEKCVYITYNNLIVLYSDTKDCEYLETVDYKKCLGFDISNKEEYYSLLSKSKEYITNEGDSSLSIKNDTVNFYISNNYTEHQNLSSVKLSESCIEKLKEEYNLPSILIFISAIKKNSYITTQVEYEFYNSEPEHINEKLNVSLYCKNEFKNESDNITTRILSMSDEWIKHNNYTINIDEVLVYVQVDWDKTQKENIDELYIKNNINIFNSGDPFYNDVCFSYTIGNETKTDIYLKDRRENYFIKDPLCETGCLQVGFEKEKERIICKCKTKNSTEGFKNRTFSPNPYFEGTPILPNIRVIKCFYQVFSKLKFNIGQIISLFLLLAFVLLSIPNFKKTEQDLLESDNFNLDDKNDKYIKKYHWEKPLDELHGNKGDDNSQENQINNNNDNNIDDEEVTKFRTPLPANSSKSDEKPKVTSQNTSSQSVIRYKTPSQNTSSQSVIRFKAPSSEISSLSVIKNVNNSIISKNSRSNVTIYVTKKKKSNPSEQKELISENNETGNNTQEIENINTETNLKNENEIFNINKSKKSNSNSEKNEKGEKKKNKKNKTKLKGKNIKEYIKKEDEKEKNTEISSKFTEKKSEKGNKKKRQKLKDKNIEEYIKKDDDTEKSSENNKENDDNEDEQKKSKKEKMFDAYTSDKGSEFSGGKVDISYSRDINSFIHNRSNEEISSNGSSRKINPKTERIDRNNYPPANPPPKDQESSARGMSNKQHPIKNQKQTQINTDDKISFHKKYLYSIIKNKNDSKFFELFMAKTISESNIFYIILKFKTGNPGYHGTYVKLPIFILYIASYIFFNILTEYDLSELHLVLDKDINLEYTKSNYSNWIVNCLLPFFFVYLVNHYIKKVLNWREFYLEEEERVKYILANYMGRGNMFNLKLHKEKTRIKKFKNNFRSNIKFISILGTIFLFLNFILVSSFCEIYPNSFKFIAVNTLISIASSLVIVLICNLIEALCKCDFKSFLFKCYLPFCNFTYFLLFLICLKKNDEQIYDIESDSDEEENKNDKNNKKEKKKEKEEKEEKEINE